MSGYERNCVHLVMPILDLPLPAHHFDHRGPESRLRDATRWPMYWLRRWVLEALDLHVLAGMVLTDALDVVCSRLDAVLDEPLREFPTAADKRELTMAAGKFWIDFEVPPGWELVFQGRTH